MPWFSAGARRLALLVSLLLVALAACSPAVTVRNPLLSLPSSTLGAVAFSPPMGATEVDPAAIVVVRPSSDNAEVKSVTVSDDAGGTLTAVREGTLFTVRSGLRADHGYHVTAAAVVHKKGVADAPETQESSFTTATTPKVVSTTPSTVGSGQAVTLTLQPAASAVEVTGEVTATLAADGQTVSVVPKQYQQGTDYNFSVVAKNLKGIAGAPQPATFSTIGPATFTTSPSNGASNFGVAQSLVITLSAAPADRDELVHNLAVTAAYTAPATAPAVQPNSTCAQYAQPAGTASGSVPFEAAWLTATKLKLVPKTADGYWPADSTISVSGTLKGVKTTAGNWFEDTLAQSFSTADKRVIDVNLTTQTLTACRNGVQANQFLISSGIPKHATETGHFWIYARISDEHMKSPEGPFAPDFYDIEHVPWTQYFDTNGSALHGAFWHNNFGHPMSHGCVNVQDPTGNTKWPTAQPQAQWLWNFDYLGDPVIVYGVTPGLTAATQPSA